MTGGRLVLAALLAAVVSLALGQSTVPASSAPAGAAAVSLPVSQKALAGGAVARLGQSRLTNGGPVQSLSFSPDGKYLLSAGLVLPPTGSVTSGQPVLRLWDVASGLEAKTLSDKLTAPNGCAAFAAGGRLVLASESPKSIGIWDLATGQQTGSIAGVGPFSVSRDGDTIALVGEDGALRLWSLSQKKELRPLTKAANPVFSPDGKLLAACTVAGSVETVRVFDASSGKESQKFDLESSGGATMRRRQPGPFGSAQTQVAFSPDGKQLAVGYLFAQTATATTLVFDIESGKQLWTAEGGRGMSAPAFVGFLPDGKTLASFVSTLVFYDAQTGQSDGKNLGENVGFNYGSLAVALSPDGKLAVLSDWTGNMAIYSIAERKVMTRSWPVQAATLSYDGSVALTADKGGNVQAWDVKAARPTAALGSPGDAPPKAVSISPDGKTAAMTTEGGAAMFDLSRPGTPTPTSAKSDFQPTDVRISPDGKRVGLVGGPAASIFDLQGKQLSSRSFEKPGFSSAAFSGDLRTVIGRVRDAFSSAVADVQTGQLRVVFQVQAANFIAPECIDQSGALAVVSTYDAGTMVTETLTSGLLANIKWQPLGTANAAAISPDRRLLAIGFMDGSVGVWDLLMNRVTRLADQRGKITALAFSGNSKRLISGAEDGTATIWDMSKLLPRLDVATQPAELEKLWEALGGQPDAAYPAMFKLAAAGAAASGLIKEKLQPAKEATTGDAQKIKSLIEGLSDSAYAKRTDAYKQLVLLGTKAVPALRDAAEKTEDADTKESIAKLLEEIGTKNVQDSQQVRSVRAVLVLLEIGDEQAVATLKSLAGGAAGLQTDAAKAALETLTGRQGLGK